MSTWTDGKRGGQQKGANGNINAVSGGRVYYDDHGWGDHGRSYNGQSISTMSGRQIEKLPAWQTISGNPNHSWVQNMQGTLAARTAQLRQEELQAMMAEYMGMMAEAANRVEPAAEPLKQAQAEMSEARADTERKQLRRRGLMSTYTRYGSNGGTQKLGI